MWFESKDAALVDLVQETEKNRRPRAKACRPLATLAATEMMNSLWKIQNSRSNISELNAQKVEIHDVLKTQSVSLQVKKKIRNFTRAKGALALAFQEAAFPSQAISLQQRLQAAAVRFRVLSQSEDQHCNQPHISQTHHYRNRVGKLSLLCPSFSLPSFLSFFPSPSPSQVAENAVCSSQRADLLRFRGLVHT